MSLTFPSVHQRSSNVSSHSHERNSADGRVREPKPHDLGLQISCCLHPEMSPQDVVSRAASASGRSVPQACASEGIEGRGRASDARSRAHAAIDPAEIRGVAVVGCIKGKSAIHMARVYGERRRNFVGQHFWARGFFVNTVGRDEEAIRAYIRNQEKEDQRLEQMNGANKPPLGGSKFEGPRQRPLLPLRAATILKPPALPGDTYIASSP